MSVNVTRKTADMWKSLAAVLNPTEQAYGSPEAAVLWGQPMAAAGRYLRFFRGLGLIAYRSEYHSTEKAGGQIVYMRRLTDLDGGLAMIYKHFDAGRALSYFENKPAKPETAPVRETVAVAPERSPEVVRAVAGPEPESPMKALAPLRRDEQVALLEAARQYGNRAVEVQKHIESLTALGVEVDIDTIMKGIKMTVDERLEAVSQVLPEYDRRGNAIDRLNQENSALRHDLTEARTEAERLRRENASLKEGNRRLSEAKVAERTPVTA